MRRRAKNIHQLVPEAVDNSGEYEDADGVIHYQKPRWNKQTQKDKDKGKGKGSGKSKDEKVEAKATLFRRRRPWGTSRHSQPLG